MHTCPASSITSWTSDRCCMKSGWHNKIANAQQSEDVHPSLHLLWSFSRHRPLSTITCRIPFGVFGYCGCSGPKFISWLTCMPSLRNHPFLMTGCAPPGFKFISDAWSASLGYAEWPWELSTRINAWYSSLLWYFSNAGMIFSHSWTISMISTQQLIRWIDHLTCFTNISPFQYPS